MFPNTALLRLLMIINTMVAMIPPITATTINTAPHQGKLVDVEEIHEVLKPVAVLVQQQFLGCPVFSLQQYPSLHGV